MKQMVRTLAVLLATLVVHAGAPAQQPYPNRPLRLIVPTPAGGPSDASARLVAQALSKSLGQQIVIENKPGASGAIAAQALVAAAPDGYTLMWTLSSMSGLALLQKASPYQSLAELTPVSLVGHFAYAMFVPAGSPAGSVAEFIELARAQPDRFSYATGSLGDYMASTKFLKAAGLQMTRVPYRGGSQLMPDLMSGRVQLNFGPLSSGLPHAKEGKLRLLAVLGARRNPLAPEAPTLAELGWPSVTLPSWQAIFAPPRTPTELVDRLAHELSAALSAPALRAQLEQLAMSVDGSTPAALAAAAARDAQAWRAFVTEYDIPAE